MNGKTFSPNSRKREKKATTIFKEKQSMIFFLLEVLPLSLGVATTISVSILLISWVTCVFPCHCLFCLLILKGGHGNQSMHSNHTVCWAHDDKTGTMCLHKYWKCCLKRMKKSLSLPHPGAKTMAIDLQFSILVNHPKPLSSHFTQSWDPLPSDYTTGFLKTGLMF